MIEPKSAEQGGSSMTLHQDKENAQVFDFYVSWESRELWLRHMESDHLKRHSVVIERYPKLYFE
ncbi:putative quinol monooxygenase [Amphritea atlantica]|nr:antibiotic biosynthesis monooxygenase [Amphritea atlantica]